MYEDIFYDEPLTASRAALLGLALAGTALVAAAAAAAATFTVARFAGDLIVRWWTPAPERSTP